MHRVFVAAWLVVVAGSSVPQSSEVQTLTSKAQVSPPLLVIVAAKTTGSDIKRAVLRNAFEGYKTEFHGKTLIPFNQESGSQARERFDRLVLGLSPA